MVYLVAGVLLVLDASHDDGEDGEEDEVAEANPKHGIGLEPLAVGRLVEVVNPCTDSRKRRAMRNSDRFREKKKRNQIESPGRDCEGAHMGWIGGGARRPRGAPRRRRGRARRGRSRRCGRSGGRCCRPPYGTPRTRTRRSTTPGKTPPTWLLLVVLLLLLPCGGAVRSNRSVGEGARRWLWLVRIWGFRRLSGEEALVGMGNACGGGARKRRGKEADPVFFPFSCFFFPLRSGWLPGRLGWTGPARADQETESVNYCIIPAFYVHYIRSSKSNRI